MKNIDNDMNKNSTGYKHDLVLPVSDCKRPQLFHFHF